MLILYEFIIKLILIGVFFILMGPRAPPLESQNFLLDSADR